MPDFEAALTGDIKGMKIGIPAEYRIDGMSVEIEELWSRGMEMLQDAGAKPVDISLPHQNALPTYYIVAPAEHRRTSLAMMAFAMDWGGRRKPRRYV